MQTFIKLTNEQAIMLYDFLANLKLNDRAKNRNRWKFIKVIEDKVVDYEERRDSQKKQVVDAKELLVVKRSDPKLSTVEKEEAQKAFNKLELEIIEAIKADGRTIEEYCFNDREVFTQGQALFDSITSVTEKENDFSGPRSQLYFEIENAFLEVRRVEDPK